MKVEGNERLVRDTGNFAILNTDREAIRTHEQKMISLRRLKATEDEINTIKRDVSDIKDMLRQLLESKQ
jgi:hypothetical protein